MKTVLKNIFAELVLFFLFVFVTFGQVDLKPQSHNDFDGIPQVDICMSASTSLFFLSNRSSKKHDIKNDFRNNPIFLSKNRYLESILGKSYSNVDFLENKTEILLTPSSLPRAPPQNMRLDFWTFC